MIWPPIDPDTAPAFCQKIHDSTLAVLEQVGPTADTHTMREHFYIWKDIMIGLYTYLPEVCSTAAIYEVQGLLVAMRAELVSRGEYCPPVPTWGFPRAEA